MKTSVCGTALLSLLPLLIPASATSAADQAAAGDRLASYFNAETSKLEHRCLAEVQTLQDWTRRKEQYRAELFEMLSLAPLPERTELRAVVTGRVEHESFTVENLHFQSMPGLYVTANLYLPKGLEKPAPTILYLSGHGPVVKEGISFGNKVTYQHHGIWFAQHGYVCLILDTVQLGEIQGIHHGTYREGMWWWNSRGYTSAGAEAWNSIRALDYLETREEVDSSRFGVTGRSGGGAYSWWVAALDDRIKAAAPVAGITDLRNHVVDGVVEGHCDCMFVVNTFRWDYAQVAALVAPRPLLIANSDKDTIFPLDGVSRVHAKVRKIYELHNARDKLGLLITEGPHKDTQDLQVPVFRWFNRFLKGEDSLIAIPAEKLFQPEQLRVFSRLPPDQRSSTIHHSFVPKAPAPAPPLSVQDWAGRRDELFARLREKTFAGWPEGLSSLDLQLVESRESGGRLQMAVYEFTSQPHVRLRLYSVARLGLSKPASATLRVMDEREWSDWRRETGDFFFADNRDREGDSPGSSGVAAMLRALSEDDEVVFFFAPRGIGSDSWDANLRKQIQIRRRFMLVGQTLEGMRVWDIRRALQAARSTGLSREVSVRVRAREGMAVNALYASLFERGIGHLDLAGLPSSHMEGPDYLNVLRILDLPEAVALALERSSVSLEGPAADWAYPAAVRSRLGWNHRLVFQD
jgi:dienelactone hydrolase